MTDGSLIRVVRDSRRRTARPATPLKTTMSTRMTPTRAIGVVTISMVRDAVSMANVLMCTSFSDWGIPDHWGFPPRNPEIPRGRSGVPCNLTIRCRFWL